MTRLDSATLPIVRAQGWTTALLPWGATEAHNHHLPYGTDTFESALIGERSVDLASARGARAMLLPALPFGVQTGQLDIPFCINLNPSTQHAILRDVIASLEPHGLRHLVVFNGHGGNDFKQIIRELQPSTKLVLFQINWYAILDARQYFDEPGDHGGELETSVMLHLVPEAVAPLGSAGPGSARRPVVTGMREGWAWTPRRWTQVSDDTGVGDPSRATAEKGAAFVSAVVERVANFLVELESLDASAMYR